MLVKFCRVVGNVVPTQIQKQGQERMVVPFNPNEFRYLRFRAIGNMEVDGANGNGDGFPYEYFEDDRPGYGYASFRGKRAHVEHNSAQGLRGSIGDLPDAYLNRFLYPPDVAVHKFATLTPQQRIAVLGSPNQRDGSVEVLMRVDMEMVKRASKDPQMGRHVDNIIRAIDTGSAIGCSMGTDVQYSWCSVCGNEARFANEYCSDLSFKKNGTSSVSSNHVRDLMAQGRMRQEWLKHLMPREADYEEVINGQSNRPVLMKVAEINHELSFFELSVVARPAYTKGYDLEKIASERGGSVVSLDNENPTKFTLWVN